MLKRTLIFLLHQPIFGLLRFTISQQFFLIVLVTIIINQLVAEIILQLTGLTFLPIQFCLSFIVLSFKFLIKATSKSASCLNFFIAILLNHLST
jgi:hypothetical protein